MEVISIEPKQVSMMVGTEVAPPLLQTMYKEAPVVLVCEEDGDER